MQKFFTPLSARAALGRLRPEAERLSGLFRSMERRRPPMVRSDQAVDAVYFSMVARFHRALAMLHEAGVFVKNPRDGLLDFPARRAGRTVFLCWKVGEEVLKYWHECGSGLAGRRLVDEDGPWEEGGPPFEGA